MGRLDWGRVECFVQRFRMGMIDIFEGSREGGGVDLLWERLDWGI